MDEATARDVLRQAVALGERIASVTPTAVDDKVVAVLRAVVEDDSYWTLAWRIVEKALGYLDADNRHQIVATDADTVHLAEEASIDPALLITVVQLIVEILNWWRNR